MLFERIRMMNEGAPMGTAYKLFLLARHGQGYRESPPGVAARHVRPSPADRPLSADNLVEAKYGTAAWDAYAPPSRHSAGWPPR